ncbi:MAG: DNA methyltransferase [Acidobacteriota bacterium]
MTETSPCDATIHAGLARGAEPSAPHEERPRLSQSVLNIDEKIRSNLFAWRGQFSPQLVEAHLAAYAKPGEIVLDPFVGSGTVLVECARRGNPALGAEINPAAAIMARTYEASAVPVAERVRILGNLTRDILLLANHEDLPLFHERTRPGLAASLLESIAHHSPGTLERNLLETLAVMLDLQAGGPIPFSKLYSTWSDLRSLVEGLPHTTQPISIALADARQLPLEPHTVDFVLTSPPYINVFNYHQQYRASVEALRWRVLPLARAEIGSNRKHRGNRFLTVVQYCLDMAQVLLELGRVCRRGARAIFVVGRESNVRKTAFYNGAILKHIASDCLGFRVALEQERVFQNRFGKQIYEDLLHLKLDSASSASWENRVRRFATDLLSDARSRAPEESRSDLDDALHRVAEVKASPIAKLQDQDEPLVAGFLHRLRETIP